MENKKILEGKKAVFYILKVRSKENLNHFIDELIILFQNTIKYAGICPSGMSRPDTLTTKMVTLHILKELVGEAEREESGEKERGNRKRGLEGKKETFVTC